ncbi:hypothetical protein DES53_104213 [Roseimicrobium gellanilyticum]|uniref:Uncharacterized protein n=1 Tax=Roseimicrobium gellanilyticum TaxID=748857 RepID=A0A366HN14_9BACT|nr:hypothetical protein [Roseimicrobium gellanilyticum]RBP44393.1 hypothetical protein DES53_104213 [Roseimicrobium gellanilyticum]
MRRRIEEYFGDFKPGEDRERMLRDLSYIISIEEWASEQHFEVTWSGDKHWGDMQVDFVIEGEQIVDEVWGD